MKHHYDIFISYRRTDTGDKAEHLKDLLEPRYKNRVSFDRENLTGLFDVSLIQRIDQCKDFLLIVGKNSFSFSEKDFAPDKVELHKYLARKQDILFTTAKGCLNLIVLPLQAIFKL